MIFTYSERSGVGTLLTSQGTSVESFKIVLYIHFIENRKNGMDVRKTEVGYSNFGIIDFLVIDRTEPNLENDRKVC